VATLAGPMTVRSESVTLRPGRERRGLIMAA
jgi:hypothetical protein